MLRLAMAQVNTIVGDLKANQKLIQQYIKKASKAKVDILIFPELTITGYPPEDLLLKNAFIQGNQKVLEELASSSDDMIVCVGYARKQGASLYNSLAILSKGKIIGSYDKIHLPNYSVFDEKRYFRPGKDVVVLKVGKASLALSICEDLWVEEGPVEKACASQTIDAIINISSSPYFRTKIKTRMDLVRFKAISNKTHLFYCNLVGGQDELVFDGGSMVASPEGRVVAVAPQFHESLLFYDLPLQKKRRKNNQKECVCYQTVSPKVEKKEKLKSVISQSESEIQEVYNALVLGIKDYVRKNGFAKVVIGLSGGIDSAVVAALAVQALGKDNVIGVTMPSKYSSKETYQDALLLAKNLGIKMKIIPINPMYDAFLSSLKKEFKGLPFDITEENLQARIRGNLMMALSNKYGWLVLTTGNKSEVSVGYCTIYGDMAGGFSVIKDLYKTVVYQLTNFINRKGDLIPKSTVTRPPSAELRPNQKDQDSLPPYELLDRILELYIEHDFSSEEIAKMGFEKKLVKKIIGLVDRNEYKRRQAPLGIKVTPKSFGKDRRMPIVNRFS